MERSISLKELERKAFRSNFQDGLWDIFIGVIILQLAIVPLFSDLNLGDFWSLMAYLPIMLSVMIFVIISKKFVVAPRIGTVNFGKTRKRKIQKLTLFLIFALTVGFFASFTFVYTKNLSDWIPPILFFGVSMASFFIASYLLDYSRLFIYGILVALSFLIGELLFRYYNVPHHGWPVVFSISGGIMIVTGIVLFSKFIKENPKPEFN